MRLKFIRNRAIFKVTSSTHEMVTFGPKEMLGVVDLRSLGYYKIKQGVLQQNLSCMYHFESVNKVCDLFNRLINTLKKEEEETCNTDKYPWVDDSDKRKHMTDREILDKYIDLEGSCLTKEERQKLRSIIYDNKYAFSLRDEIGTVMSLCTVLWLTLYYVLSRFNIVLVVGTYSSVLASIISGSGNITL